MTASFPMWSIDHFLIETACVGPYTFGEFLPQLIERLKHLKDQVDHPRSKWLRTSSVTNHWVRPDSLSEGEARITFDTEFPRYNPPDFLSLESKGVKFSNTSFHVDLFGRNVERVTVAMQYGFSNYRESRVRNELSGGLEFFTTRGGRYVDEVCVPGSEDVTPLVSLMLQIIFETALYAKVLQDQKWYSRRFHLEIAQKRFEVLSDAMAAGFMDAVSWVNDRMSQEQKASREAAYVSHLQAIDAPHSARDYAGVYAARFNT
jgi:hypothetical protein